MGVTNVENSHFFSYKFHVITHDTYLGRELGAGEVAREEELAEYVRLGLRAGVLLKKKYVGNQSLGGSPL